VSLVWGLQLQGIMQCHGMHQLPAKVLGGSFGFYVATVTVKMQFMQGRNLISGKWFGGKPQAKGGARVQDGIRSRLDEDGFG